MRLAFIKSSSPGITQADALLFGLKEFGLSFGRLTSIKLASPKICHTVFIDSSSKMAMELPSKQFQPGASHAENVADEHDCIALRVERAELKCWISKK